MRYILSIACLLSSTTVGIALPKNPSVISGKAKVSLPNKKTMRIEASDHAILQFSDFSVGSGETVQYILPNPSSAILCRVTKNNKTSQILGNITNNGELFLINTSGIQCESASQLSVSTLILSSLDIQNADFLKNTYTFSIGSKPGSLIHKGTIDIDETGFAILIGPTIHNLGTIIAPQGDIGFIAGETVNFAPQTNGTMQCSVSGTLPQAMFVLQGSCVSTALHLTMSQVEDANLPIRIEGEQNLTTTGKTSLTQKQTFPNLYKDANFLSPRNGTILIADSATITASQILYDVAQTALLSLYSKSKWNQTSGTYQVIAPTLIVERYNIQSSSGSGKILLKSTSPQGSLVLSENALIEAPHGYSLTFASTSSKMIANQAEISTEGQDILFQCPIFIEGDHLKIHTNEGSGKIQFFSKIQGSENQASQFTVESPRGFILFQAPIGDNTPLGALTFCAERINLSTRVMTKGEDVEICGKIVLYKDLSIDTTCRGHYPGGQFHLKGADSGLEGSNRLFINTGQGQVLLDANIGQSSFLERMVIFSHSTKISG